MADKDAKKRVPPYVPIMIGLAVTVVFGTIVYLVFMRKGSPPKKAAAAASAQASAPPTLQATSAAGSQAWDTAVQQISNLEAQRKSALYARLGTMLSSMGSSPQEYSQAMLGAGVPATVPGAK